VRIYYKHCSLIVKRTDTSLAKLNKSWPFINRPIVAGSEDLHASVKITLYWIEFRILMYKLLFRF